MKPTPQISSTQHKRRNFPLTDYQFRSTLDSRAGAPAIREKSISELRTFRKVSSAFFAGEANREYAAELLLFILIAGISAWPIILAITAAIRLLTIH